MCQRVVTTPSATRWLGICCGSSCTQDRQGAEVSVFSQALHSFFKHSPRHWLVHPREICVPGSDVVLGIRKLLLADPNRQHAACAGLPGRFAGQWLLPLWGQSWFLIFTSVTHQEGTCPVLPTWEVSHIIQKYNFLTQWCSLRDCALCQGWNMGLVCCTKPQFWIHHQTVCVHAPLLCSRLCICAVVYMFLHVHSQK